ncbi:prolyl 4-hydroxylase subunit alpha-1-like [Musca autumnalis]|uniref:prolyl 4-hydroxylase subunit alpha-1-like n=1 Tax=Musca autumnalis TaxID=221902 RepID=UPI003CE78702
MCSLMPIQAFYTSNFILPDTNGLYNESSQIPDDEVTLPTVDDLRGAARGLSRLQQLYKLDITNITKGYIIDQKYSSEMSAYNCYIMGKSLYESEEYLAASEWLMEALNKSEEMEKSLAKQENIINWCNDNVSNHSEDKDFNCGIGSAECGIFPYVSITEILELLGSALYYADRPELALLVNSRLLSIEPGNEIGLSNKKMFQPQANIVRRMRFITPGNEQNKKSEMQNLYEQVCNGEVEQNMEMKRNLNCHLTNKNLPYYILGPLKMEELNKDPPVAVYYDVIYNEEIKEIIETSKSGIERSEIGDIDEGTPDEVRISKNSWLGYDSPIMSRISQRLADITGLSMDMSEEMQVANYGIGGYYGTHYDFSENPDEENPKDGNRILTAMFYLNNVDLGGATAFPHLRLAVPPIKHSLVVWYNLHKSLEPDYRTAHAGCPVLKGSKWIGNVWFHTVGQELNRPCDLKPDGDISKPHKAMGLD